MDDEITPLGELELWDRPSPGHVAPWVQAVLVLVTILGVVIVGVAGWALWQLGHGPPVERAGFILLPMFLMATAVAITVYPDGTLSRFVRLAVALPAIHAIALIVALICIPQLDMPALGLRTPLVEAVPPVACFAIGLGVLGVLARLIGGKGEGWAHALVMLALSFLLLLGLWLPIAAQLPVREDPYGFYQPATLALLHRHSLAVVLLAGVPPLVGAVLYTLLASAAPRFTRRVRPILAGGVGVLFVAAMVYRVRSNRGAFLVHDNLTHLLLAAVMLAIVATSILALATWLAGRRTLRDLAGAREGSITEAASEIVGCLQITSWLRGPRLWMRGFVATSAGELLQIPRGATLATPLPRISSAMRLGEAVAILRVREPITLSGFVEAEVGDSPFRSVRMSVPGPAGITVGRREPLATAGESMLLTAWRPAVAYLVIVIVVALPTLIGLFVDGAW